MPDHIIIDDPEPPPEQLAKILEALDRAIAQANKRPAALPDGEPMIDMHPTLRAFLEGQYGYRKVDAHA